LTIGYHVGWQYRFAAPFATFLYHERPEYDIIYQRRAALISTRRRGLPNRSFIDRISAANNFR